MKRKDYRLVEDITFDPDYSLADFVNNYEESLDIEAVQNWTNTMLADKLDEPFFRWSMFDNYLVVNDMSEWEEY